MHTGIFQKKIDIGGFITPNNVFMAPLAGYTDAPFRAMVRKLGAGLTVTEMVSCKGLCYGSEKTEELLALAQGEVPSSAQIFGNDPEIMLRAVESPALQRFDIIDVNMGCPVPKIFKNGEGRALMGDVKRAHEIVAECKKSGKIITVKFRTGISRGNENAVDFAKALEDAGADMITVHGRTRQDFYSGDINYAQIKGVKNAVKIPVIANGGIFSVQDADEMIERTGADGVAIGRGALSDPLLFSKLSQAQTDMSLKDSIFYLIDKRLTYEKDQTVAHDLRKFAVQILKGVRGGKEAKLRIFQAESTNEIKDILNNVL